MPAHPQSIYHDTMPEETTQWYLHIRTADDEHSFCCMSKEQAMEMLIDEVDRLRGEVIEAELRHPSGYVEILPLV